MEPSFGDPPHIHHGRRDHDGHGLFCAVSKHDAVACRIITEAVMHDPLEPLFILFRIKGAHLQMGTDRIIVCKHLGIDLLRDAPVKAHSCLKDLPCERIDPFPLFELLIKVIQIDDRADTFSGSSNSDPGSFGIVLLYLPGKGYVRSFKSCRKACPYSVSYAFIKILFSHHDCSSLSFRISLAASCA